MLGINSNINSLVAQQNLTGSQSALSQAITRLSSGKRINSAADDAAGLAISTGMQTQINGLNQGVSNANDGVSMIQTASSGLSQITSSLQRIRTLAVQASSGGLTADNRAALQQEVTQQIAEVNRIASQTTYNGKSVLDGSAGNVSFQVGANVGQSINLNLSQGVSAASLGKGVVAAGNTLGTLNNLSLDAKGNAVTSGAAITSINVLSDGKGGFTYTDQNNQALSNTAVSALFGQSTGSGTPLNLSLSSSSALAVGNQLKSIVTSNATPPTGAGTTLGTISGISVSATTGQNVAAGTAGAITSITVKSDGNGSYQFFDQSGNALANSLVGTNSATNPGSLFTITKSPTGGGDNLEFTNEQSQLDTINAGNTSGGLPIAVGTTLGNVTNLSLDANGNTVASGSATITSITVKADGSGGFNFFDQSGAAVSQNAFDAITGSAKANSSPATGSGNITSSGNLFTITKDANGTGNAKLTLTAPAASQLTTINGANTATSTAVHTINNISLDPATGQAVAAGTAGAITSVTITEDGTGGFSFTDQNGKALAQALTGVSPTATGSGSLGTGVTVSGSLFTITGGATTASLSFTNGAPALVSATPDATPKLTALTSVNSNNTPGTVASVDVSTTAGANLAMESIDNALTTVNNIQATLGAAQNRFTAISTSQAAESTDLSTAQSNITDANFAQETANLSKAQVLQQAGISVLAQANSMPQQVLKLLQ